MNIIYISGSRIPTEKAHGLQTAKMCEAFAQNGADLELWIPRRFNPIKEDLFDYYGIKREFRVKKIPIADFMPLSKFLGPFAFYLTKTTFLFFVLLYIFPRRKEILYTRDKFFASLASLLGWNVFFEAHTVSSGIFFSFIKKTKGIIVITHQLKNIFEARGIKEKRILVAPDGVDLEEFQIEESKRECREKLELPQDKKIVLYAGHLYPWKGAGTLLRAAKLSIFNYQFSNTLFVFVGGTENDIGSYKLKAISYKLSNVLIIGHRPHKEMPYWLKAADVLVLPNSGKYDISKFWTSPMKLFEYMASGVPIVASDLPSIREILNEDNAVLVEPDNSEDLASGLGMLLKDKELANRLAMQAFLSAENHTWQNRAEKIIAFISNISK